ncbi:hypothetical protein TWF718_003005 [Orbilia javanica]|uniref:Nudix hydrolase domain-containing protein n=1 Tax=Orbilia javanica TaxID=47235 RepID=A0AAN8MGX9_9PEZI
MAPPQIDGVPSRTIGIKADDIEYQDRLAVRVIVQREESDKIIIIHVKKGNYYKLPGGGVEGDEDYQLAATREVLEETGCKASIETECIGAVEEWRNDLHQISYCYVGSVTDDSGRPELTEDEVLDGLVHEWAPVHEALHKMKGIKPTSELGLYIQKRDTFLLETFLGQSSK